MNYSTAIFLINPNVRAVVGIYDAEVPAGPKQSRYTFKTLDPTIKVGDYVLVPTNTRHEMTVNKIVEVDVEPDLETNIEFKWVISKIDRPQYQEILAQEASAIDLMKAAEKTHLREELRKKVLAHVDETKLNALQITQIGGPAPIAPPNPVPFSET